MVARFRLHASPQDLAAWSHVPSLFPGADARERRTSSHRSFPALRLCPSTEKRQIVAMREGLIPSYAHDEDGAEDRVNAHAEALTTTSCFRAAFLRRRCIVPATELTLPQHDSAGETHWLSLSRRSGALFGIAAVWETWTNDHGVAVETFAVITAPTASTTPELDRMPVILADHSQVRWLHAGAKDDLPFELLRGLSASELHDWRLAPYGLKVAMGV